MGRVPLLFLVLFLVGAQFCFVSTLARSSRRTPEDNSSKILHEDHPTLQLTTVGISAEGYKAFIAKLRCILESSKDRYGIPLLPSEKRSIRVKLSNHAGETITLMMDANNADVSGYSVNGISVSLIYTSDDYPMLEKLALRRRQGIKLGTRALEESISTLSWYANYVSSLLHPSLAHAYLVIVQMISEAARFRYIENEVSSRIRDNADSAPDPSVIQLEDSWGRLSSEIQGSNQGMFRNPVPLRRRDGSWFEVFNVQSVAASISLMSVACKSSSSHSQKLSPLISLVTSESESDCPVDVEPTLQIVGPGGMCLAPRGGWYHNGNPIVLSSCKSSQDEDQQWSFKRDGTIQSRGRCMAAYSLVPAKENYIMIYTCDPSSDAFRWRVWPNGTITSASGLVLSMTSSAVVGSDELTLGENAYSPGQSWLPTNNTTPSVAPIVGVFGFCLQASGDEVLLQKCVDTAEDQAWALYPDGSIRPRERRSSCLAIAVGDLVRIVDCDPSSSLQRWLFANDGTILNPGSLLVMGVTGYVGSGLRVFADEPSGGASQQWQALVP